MIFIGIDPGLQGGIATIREDGVVARPMFTVTIEKAGKKRKAYDHAALSDYLWKASPRDFYAIIEEQHPMVRFRGGKKQKQGVTSTFSIGYGFGALRQCLFDFNIPHDVVRAKEWQKTYGIHGKKGDTKEQALEVCKELFPDVNLLATTRSKKPHSGLVDAILIAEWGKRRYEERNDKRTNL